MDVSMDVDVDVDMDENMMSMGSGTGAASTGGQVFRSSARNPRMDLGTITSDDSFRRSGVSNYSASTHNPPYPSSLPPLHRLPDHGPHPYVLPPLPPPRDTDVKSYPSSVSAHLQSLDHRPSYPWAQGSQGHTPQQAHLTQDSSYPPHPAALGLSEPQGINTPSSMNPSLHGPLTGPGHHQSTSGAIPSGMYSNHPSAITTSQPNAFAPAAAPRSRNNTNSGVQSKRVAEMAALSSARLMGTPPAGVTQCAYCGTTSSPEWRKGETGIKNLCNA
ncbi:hypothetical protein DL93DRAFT_2082639 [Clavulina sp. PMI_390]|nr:hypothetical protein DL93DRAFT_2082639 [Clavulina sp. PMI_390]